MGRLHGVSEAGSLGVGKWGNWCGVGGKIGWWARGYEIVAGHGRGEGCSCFSSEL